jgi:hypothetical protein
MQDVMMAVKTLFRGRHPRMFGLANVWMTELTLDLLNPGVYAMAKRYELLRADIGCRRYIKIIKKPDDQHNATSDQKEQF